MTAPLAFYGAALRRAAAGQGSTLEVVDPTGTVGRVDAATWSGGLVAGDISLLARCCGPTLDVGCGPGRLVAALHRAGRAAMGVDVSPEAVRQAQRRGLWAVRADVFGPLPGEGQWRTVLLADGNIGIGGDPPRLLRRCASLLDPAGAVLAELRAPGEASWSGDVVLRDPWRRSAPFPWATVSADRTAEVADRAGLRVCREWTEAGRWFAELRVR
jgi:SAM-dependent methyltransferase